MGKWRYSSQLVVNLAEGIPLACDICQSLLKLLISGLSEALTRHCNLCPCGVSGRIFFVKPRKNPRECMKFPFFLENAAVYWRIRGFRLW